MSKDHAPEPIGEQERRKLEAVRTLAQWYQNDEVKYRAADTCRFHMLEILDPRHSPETGASMYLRTKVRYMRQNSGEDTEDYRVYKRVEDILEGNDDGPEVG